MTIDPFTQILIGGIGGLVGGLTSLFVKQFLDWVTHRNSQFQRLVDEIEKEIAALVLSCRQYWIDGAEGQSMASYEMIHGVRDLSALVELAMDWHPEARKNIRRALMEIHRSATGGSFGSLRRDPDLQQMLLINSAAMELKVEIKRMSRRHYKLI